jgi:hypothetical protein
MCEKMILLFKEKSQMEKERVNIVSHIVGVEEMRVLPLSFAFIHIHLPFHSSIVTYIGNRYLVML